MDWEARFVKHVFDEGLPCRMHEELLSGSIRVSANPNHLGQSALIKVTVL